SEDMIFPDSLSTHPSLSCMEYLSRKWEFRISLPEKYLIMVSETNFTLMKPIVLCLITGLLKKKEESFLRKVFHPTRILFSIRWKDYWLLTIIIIRNKLMILPL